MLSFAWLAIICRTALSFARHIVPTESRAAWLESWQGDYWYWLLKAEAYRSPDGRSALIAHSSGAVRAAIACLRESPETLRRRDHLTGHPAFPSVVLLAVLLAVVVWTGAVPETRRLIQPPAQPRGSNLVLLSQSGQFLGSRRGFTSYETERFAKQAKTVWSVASQQWYRAPISIDGAVESISATNVGPRFFTILGVQPAFGQVPAADDEFLVSYAFWRDELHEPAIGTAFRVAGRTRRLWTTLAARPPQRPSALPTRGGLAGRQNGTRACGLVPASPR